MRPPQRPTARHRLPLGAAVGAAVLLWVLPLALAQQISYTIQVVALSDADSALTIQGDLLRQGFPAYVVRSGTSQGDAFVYRVRIGAFANRPAALLYAESMPRVAGGQPVPALAEGIPAGLTPYAPRLVLSRELTGLDARLLMIGQALALRTQQRSPLAQAEYELLAGGAVESVRAWQLSVDADGVRTVVRDLRLWPDTWQDEPEEVLEGHQNSLITLVAERLGLDPATVRAARYGTTAGAPRLIVVERSVPGAPDGPELLGLGLPVSGMTPSGPLQYLGVDPEDLPGLPDGVKVDLAAGTVEGELVMLASSSTAEEAQQPGGEADEEANEQADEQAGTAPGEGEPPAEPGGEAAAGTDVGPEAATEAAADLIGGPDWYAQPDGPYIRLTVPPLVEGATPVTWRAALGTPLWSGAGYLAAYLERSLLVYDFLPRD